VDRRPARHGQHQQDDDRRQAEAGEAGHHAQHGPAFYFGSPLFDALQSTFASSGGTGGGWREALVPDGRPAPGGWRRRSMMARILLVEDNEMNRDMLSRRLQRKGHEVLMAADGMQAILMAESESPDLILLDMSLPVIDGWEAARRLKAQASTKQVPVIALTAHAMAGDREKALAAGCDDYDTKPVDFPQLLAKIDRLVGPPRP